MPLKTALALSIGAVVHECGHLLALRLCGVRYGGISLRIGGAVMCGEFSCVPYRAEAFCAAAGPFFNLLLMVIGKTLGFEDLTAANLLLAGYNLLPLPGHDGQTVLRVLCAQMGFAVEAERLLGVLSLFCAALLFMFSAWIFWYGACIYGSGGFASGGLFLCLAVRALAALSR
ncbi:MAG: hypothetical protein J6S41_00555 [Clostridia bacterium]|nr:hypothetical protein [Clostridia bacterium]MBO5670013.1 hypothetical protein [Clostridia bacterium]